MRFEVLGPVEVLHEGRSYVPSAAKLRQMLALLLLNHNQVVTVAALQEEVWGTTPPRSGAAAVHTHMMQLRKALEAPGSTDSPSHRLVTSGRGYVLRCAPAELDTHRFDALVTAGRLAVSDGQLAAGSSLLASALSLWHGPALADVTTGALLATTALALEERRLEVLAERIDVDLRLGRHHELVAETTALVQRHPGREVFTAQLMTALNRSWRRADALNAFHRLREHLARQYRQSPSRELHRLYSSILSSDSDGYFTVDEPFRLSLDLFSASR